MWEGGLSQAAATAYPLIVYVCRIRQLVSPETSPVETMFAALRWAVSGNPPGFAAPGFRAGLSGSMPLLHNPCMAHVRIHARVSHR